MGEDDIQFIPTPKAKLLRWWGQLDQPAQEFVKAKLGHLLSLIHITVRPEVIQSIAHFWCPRTLTFIFGRFELTPTLEEFSIITGMPIGKELVKLLTGPLPWCELAEFLGAKINVMKRILANNNYTCPLGFLDACFQNQSMAKRSEIFLLAFFGLIIFPHQRNAISPRMIWIVDQILGGANYVNLILAETLLSLDLFKDKTEKIMWASPEILQVWFFSHLSKYWGIMRSNASEHPLQKFIALEPYIPNQTSLHWIDFLRNPAPKAFQWCADRFHKEGARHPNPLSDCAIPYHPARQFGTLQRILPPSRRRTPPILFNTSHDFALEISTTKEIWDKCHHEQIMIPEGLEGEEESHHASTFCIHKYHIPAKVEAIGPSVHPRKRPPQARRPYTNDTGSRPDT